MTPSTLNKVREALTMGRNLAATWDAEDFGKMCAAALALIDAEIRSMPIPATGTASSTSQVVLYCSHCGARGTIGGSFVDLTNH